MAGMGSLGGEWWVAFVSMYLVVVLLANRSEMEYENQIHLAQNDWRRVNECRDEKKKVSKSHVPQTLSLHTNNFFFKIRPLASNHCKRAFRHVRSIE